MSIIGLVLFVCILGAVAFVVSKIEAVPPTFKNIVYVVLLVIALLICANALGLLDALHQPVPQL